MRNKTYNKKKMLVVFLSALLMNFFSDRKTGVSDDI